MNKHPKHTPEAFWKAWEDGNPALLSDEERAMFALARSLENLYAPPPQHQAHLWEQLRTRQDGALRRYHIRRHRMMFWKTTRNFATAAISLILLVVLLQWSIHSLPAKPASPMASITPASPLKLVGCPPGIFPLQPGEAPSNAATLGCQSVQVGNFWFTLLVYCDPSLKADGDSLIDGLGIWGQWDDQGTFQEGSLTEWWGPEGEEILIDTLSAPLATPITRFGGWIVQSPVDFTRPQVTLTSVHSVHTSDGTFGARLHLTLRATSTGWQVDNVRVDAVETPGARPTSPASTSVIAPPRLSWNSTPEEIRVKVQNPSWKSVWVAGTRTNMNEGWLQYG
ncbi:MAG: hypothetical protein Fur0018_26680 [Anaerolineales bacterium]